MKGTKEKEREGETLRKEGSEKLNIHSRQKIQKENQKKKKKKKKKKKAAVANGGSKGNAVKRENLIKNGHGRNLRGHVARDRPCPSREHKQSARQ